LIQLRHADCSSGQRRRGAGVGDRRGEVGGAQSFRQPHAHGIGIRGLASGHLVRHDALEDRAHGIDLVASVIAPGSDTTTLSPIDCERSFCGELAVFFDLAEGDRPSSLIVMGMTTCIPYGSPVAAAEQSRKPSQGVQDLASSQRTLAS
jgi:hypothetical protein